MTDAAVNGFSQRQSGRPALRAGVNTVLAPSAATPGRGMVFNGARL